MRNKEFPHSCYKITLLYSSCVVHMHCVLCIVYGNTSKAGATWLITVYSQVCEDLLQSLQTFSFSLFFSSAKNIFLLQMCFLLFLLLRKNSFFSPNIFILRFFLLRKKIVSFLSFSIFVFCAEKYVFIFLECNTSLAAPGVLAHSCNAASRSKS